jgi:hypothetical protein
MRSRTMGNWGYDIATQAIAGVISAAVVGAVLLRAQGRIEKKLDRERRLLDSQRELLGAAIQMHQVVARTFAVTGSGDRVASGWSEAHRAAADWGAIEATRDFSEDVLKVSRTARETLEQDLLAIMAMSPAHATGEASADERARWLSIGKRRPFEVLEALIAVCKQERPQA